MMTIPPGGHGIGGPGEMSLAGFSSTESANAYAAEAQNTSSAIRKPPIPTLARCGS